VSEGQQGGQWLPPEGAGEQPPQQPPPGWYPPQPPPGYYYPWAHLQPQPHEPGNGPAVAGFVLSLCGIALLVFTIGIFFIASLPCSILGIVFGRKGKRNVRAGETRKHEGLAQAGFIVGIVGTVLGVIAAAGWILLFALDDEFVDDLDDPNRDFDFDTATAFVQTAARLALRLIL
jgi:hypothetical protein